MSTSTVLQPHDHSPRYLLLSVKAWAFLTALGQLVFLVYLVDAYALRGSSVHPVLAGHVAGAAIIQLSGLLQFIPAVRRSYPGFHRYNGRLYVLFTAFAAVSGIVLIWADGLSDASSNKYAMTIEALLILAFGVITALTARRGEMTAHQVWAVRLFLVASGVWFFRIMLMAWMLVNGGKPVGINPETFEGPTIDVISFAHYLLPLAVYELYLFVQGRGGRLSRLNMAGLMWVLTALTAIGIVGASFGMWWG